YQCIDIVFRGYRKKLSLRDFILGLVEELVVSFKNSKMAESDQHSDENLEEASSKSNKKRKQRQI
ncbi:hypothetical protein SK128_012141, partial [Halocaridina rubra]